MELPMAERRNIARRSFRIVRRPTRRRAAQITGRVAQVTGGRPAELRLDDAPLFGRPDALGDGADEEVDLPTAEGMAGGDLLGRSLGESFISLVCRGELRPVQVHGFTSPIGRFFMSRPKNAWGSDDCCLSERSAR